MGPRQGRGRRQGSRAASLGRADFLRGAPRKVTCRSGSGLALLGARSGLSPPTPRPLFTPGGGAHVRAEKPKRGQWQDGGTLCGSPSSLRGELGRSGSALPRASLHRKPVVHPAPRKGLRGRRRRAGLLRLVKWGKGEGGRELLECAEAGKVANPGGAGQGGLPGGGGA